MNIKLSYKKVYLLAFMGIVSYIILIAIAMLTYPGGIKDNTSIVGYTFWVTLLVI